MNKNIKDYLHLYIGCKILLPMTKHTYVLTSENLQYVIEDRDKPILRPLSDMTEEEGKEISFIIYQSIYGHTSEINIYQIVNENNDTIGFKGKDLDGDSIGLTIECNRGIEFSINGIKLMVRQFDIIPLLLKNHFDLFGLIEAGLAIDSTTLKQSTPNA